MIKKYKKSIIATSIITLLPVLAGIILWNRLPDLMPTNFSASGEVNSYSSKAFSVFFFPLFLLFIHLLCLFATLSDPKNKNRNTKVFSLVLYICPAVSILCSTLMYGTALGYNLDVTTIMLIFMGIMFTVVGNYLPKCRQNYTIGIKLPWTLSSEANWKKTHKLAGYLWTAGGILILLTSFLKSFWLFMTITVLLVLIPTVYSYIYHIKNEK